MSSTTMISPTSWILSEYSKGTIIENNEEKMVKELKKILKSKKVEVDDKTEEIYNNNKIIEKIQRW